MCQTESYVSRLTTKCARSQAIKKLQTMKEHARHKIQMSKING